MTLEGLWQEIRRGYSRVNAFLEQYYRYGAADHGTQGIVREFLDGSPDGVRLSWTHDQQGPVCGARDARGAYRIELHQEGGRWSARACSCLGFREFQRECRHLRAARRALAYGDADLSAREP